jgi:hypothetical protein
MHRLLSLLGLLLISMHAACAATSFDEINCKSNVASALIGRQMADERIVAIEARYKDISLKNLGAFGMESEGDPWTLVSWSICGREYLVLERHGIVRDALASPLKSGGPQSQVASCTVDGSSLSGTVVVFLDADDKKWPKPVKYAWLIDNTAIRFGRIKGNEIICGPQTPDD